MKVGDLVKFQDPTGEFPMLRGKLATIVKRDSWATVVEWFDGTRDDISNYMVNDPLNTYLDEWLEIVSANR